MEPLDEIRALAADRVAVVVDDDATGSQAVREVDVVTRPEDGALLRERLAAREAGFFVLTNSRSLDEREATILARDLGARIRDGARELGRDVSLVSRSDSTLRGHFPAEVDALAAGFGMTSARILLAPYFGEAGRVTADDTHFLVRDGQRTPVAETEFATDPAFGYRESNLLAWVAAKAPGRAAVSVSLDTIRASRGDAVRAALGALPPSGVCVVNALEQRDIELAALGALRAERDGVDVVARTAASYVRARLGQPVHGLIEPASKGVPGLVVVGSHVGSTTAQLRRLVEAPPIRIDLLELDVDAIVDDPGSVPGAVAAVAARADAAMAAGTTPVVATSRRRRETGSAAGDRALARAVSHALVGTVRAIRTRPAWVVAKGGITSSDIAVQAFGVAAARVLGQVAPGVSAWRLGPESRQPGLVYVVFGGNVGDEEALRAVVSRLGGEASISAARRPASAGPR